MRINQKGNLNTEQTSSHTVRSGQQKYTSYTSYERINNARKDPSSHRQNHCNTAIDRQINMNQETASTISKLCSR